MLKLENWVLIHLTKPVFVGKIFNHTIFPNNSDFTTRYFKDLDPKTRILTCEDDQKYLLGEVDRVWHRNNLK